MLAEREKEFEKTITLLNSIGLGLEDSSKLKNLTTEIETILNEWSKLVGNNKISKILNPLILSARNETNADKVRMTARIIDLLISPFEHYMISLEEFKSNVPRDAATRCGMVVERVTRQLWIQINKNKPLPTKVEDRIGAIQNELTTKLHIKGIEDFCSLMKFVYHIRDWKGPHDVPAAETLEAKFCITSISQIYSFYLLVFNDLGYDLKELIAPMSEFVNSIVLLSPVLVSGKKGKVPLIDDVILNLYQNGFFKMKKTFNDICNKIEERYHFPKSTIMDCLNRFCFKRKS